MRQAERARLARNLCGGRKRFGGKGRSKTTPLRAIRSRPSATKSSLKQRGLDREADMSVVQHLAAHLTCLPQRAATRSVVLEEIIRLFGYGRSNGSPTSCAKTS